MATAKKTTKKVTATKVVDETKAVSMKDFQKKGFTKPSGYKNPLTK
jgi:hypothetical protein